ncbi:hypothetical protein [Cyclobacterium sp. SYSU L10401]|uniref:hypothetical protein n=1 Tax=Cyclobacterium sp. SYSU L10401 TaxID=2678657 RepID=UPI0013CFF489|nr:hypothetical protein [Cyclobacterium sp. SYSU L10401]
MKDQSSIFRKTLISFQGIEVPVTIWTFDHELNAIKGSPKNTDFLRLTSSPCTVMEVNIKRVEKIEPLNEIRHKRSPSLTHAERFIHQPSYYFRDYSCIPHPFSVENCLLAFKKKNEKSLVFKFPDNRIMAEDLFLTSISLYKEIIPTSEKLLRNIPSRKLFFAEFLVSK